jgi:hypothetical protein
MASQRSVVSALPYAREDRYSRMPDRKRSVPEVLLEHAEDRRALLVGEHVEHALGVLR